MQRDEKPDQALSDAWCGHVIPEQTPGEMITSMLISRSWCRFYNTPKVWKAAIASHFGIAMPRLNLFANIVFNITAIENIDYRLIYIRLHRFQQTEDADDYSPGKLLKNPERHLELLACCLDNVAVARRVLPNEHEECWRKAVLLTDSVNIFKELLPPTNNDYVKAALSARSDAIIQHYLEVKVQSTSALPFSRHHWFSILRLGHLTHAQYLIANQPPNQARLEHDPDFYSDLLFNKRIPLRYSFDLFMRVASNPATQMTLMSQHSLDALLYRKKEDVETAEKFIQFFCGKKIRLNDMEISWTSICNNLITAGYIDYAKYLLTAHQVQAPLTKLIFYWLGKVQALSPENLHFFLNPANSWALAQTVNSLEYIIHGGHYETLLFLLDPVNGYQFQLSDKIYELAARTPDSRILQYLLAQQSKLSCKPQPSSLTAAIKYRKPENAEILLDPAFGLVPTEENLKEAVSCNLYDIVKLLMSEERQYGLTFTLDMLRTACEPRLNASTYFNPDLKLIQFMLEPRFGLTVTQRFFDSLYCNSHQLDAYRQYNKIDILLFFLDNYNVTLTQEKFEHLFFASHLFSIADLPALFPKRFSYLKPTRVMLNKAFQANSRAYVNYILQPCFALPVDGYVLSSVIYMGMENLAESLQLDHGLVPTETDIIRLLEAGNVEYAQRLLTRHAMTMSEFLLNQLPNFPLHSMAFALELARKSGLLSPNKPKQYDVLTKSLEHNELLLDPQYHYYFAFSNLSDGQQLYINFVFKNVPAIERLVNADLAIKAAIAQLNRGDGERATLEFTQALHLSARQCFRVAAYALAHPHEYQLSENARQQLLSRVTEATQSLEAFSIIDLMAIKKYFADAQLPMDEIESFLDAFIIHPDQRWHTRIRSAI